MLHPLPFLASSALHASIVLAVPLWVAAMKKSKTLAKVSLLTFGLYMLQSAILSMPNDGIFASLHYTWYQKVVVIVVCFCLLKPLGLTASKCGFNAPENRRSYGLAVLIGALVFFIGMMFDPDTAKFDLETLLFELSLPGIHEELFYRGLLLAIWDRAFAEDGNLSAVKINVGAIVSMFLFVLGHLVFLDQNYQLRINTNLFAWIDLIVFSSAMTWMRYEYKSVWPAVIAHNVGNTVPQFLCLFRSR